MESLCYHFLGSKKPFLEKMIKTKIFIKIARALKDVVTKEINVGDLGSLMLHNFVMLENKKTTACIVKAKDSTRINL